jgi:hypothetical protein
MCPIIIAGHRNRHSVSRSSPLISEDSVTGLSPVILSSTCVPNILALARSSDAYPDHIDADPACHFHTDPDP